MALIQTVNPSDLYHMACRMDRGDSFGYAGWNAIGEYLEELSNGTGEDVEIDIIAICCEYSMSESADEFWNEYGSYSTIDADEWEEMDDGEKVEAVQDYLNDKTSVVFCEDGCIIWAAF